MRHSLELIPDEPGDLSLRRDWELLHRAGLPSQSDHRGATNAPHVTAISLPVIDEELRRSAAATIGPLLPVRCTLTGLVVLGDRRLVLARLVEVPDAPVTAVLDVKAATHGHAFPGWLPPRHHRARPGPGRAGAGDGPAEHVPDLAGAGVAAPLGPGPRQRRPGDGRTGLVLIPRARGPRHGILPRQM